MPHRNIAFLLLCAFVPQVVQTTCFVSDTSLIRRDVIQIVPGGLSHLACQVLCMKDLGCTAIQMTSNGNCVLFGAEITATVGQCPAPFTCQRRMESGCVPKPIESRNL